MRADRYINSDMRSVLSLFLSMAIISIMGVFSRNLFVYMSTPQQVFFRILAACLILYLVSHRKIDLKKSLHAPIKEHAIMFTRALSIYVLAIICGTLAYTKGKYGNIGCVMSLPVAGIMGILFFKERPGKIQIVATLIFVTGLFIIASKNTASLFTWDLAYYYAILCNILLSFGLIAHKWNKALNNFETTFMMMLYGSLQLFLCVIITDGFHGVRICSFAVFLILCGGVCNILLLLFSNYGIKSASGTMMGIAFSTQPIFSMIYGYFFFSELPSTRELLGAYLIIVCLCIVGRNSGPSKERLPETTGSEALPIFEKPKLEAEQ